MPNLTTELIPLIFIIKKYNDGYKKKIHTTIRHICISGFINSRHLVGQALFSNKPAYPIGLQLYTLGDLMTTDTKGTLKKLAAIGYKEVESAGSQKGNFYGYKPKEFAAMVKDAGLHWRSAHVGGAPFSMEQHYENG